MATMVQNKLILIAKISKWYSFFIYEPENTFVFLITVTDRMRGFIDHVPSTLTVIFASSWYRHHLHLPFLAGSLV